jgi:carbonic anhydrase/acetyltransferase-like protein (isoleucine patch superfamily)
MPFILPVRGFSPEFGNNTFIAPNATIVGEVSMGDDCSIWFNAVVRGDVNFIKMGNKVNIQDNAVVHGTFEKNGTTIGNNVSIGHNAIVHGCTIEDDALIGMGAIVLDKAHVGKGCLVGAGSVVTERSVLEPGWLYAGIPARKIKPVDEDRKEIMKRTVLRYPEYGKQYQMPEEVQ